MEIRVRGYGKSFRAGYNECNEMWRRKLQEKIDYNHLFEDDYATDVLQELLNANNE